jgi:hypothetical protein
LNARDATDKTLEIAFRGIEPSPELESKIREHVAKLERRFEHYHA